MRVLPSRLDGPIFLEPTVHRDERGFFHESFREEQWRELGIDERPRFVQENQSRSARGVVRGLHFHVGPGAAKLVRCARGRVLDVVVDLRRGSPTYAEWEGFELDDERFRQVFVPVGFAHGFCALSEVADVLYKQTAYYDPAIERAIVFDDSAIGIAWPADLTPTVSARDRAAPALADIAEELPFALPTGPRPRAIARDGDS